MAPCYSSKVQQKISALTNREKDILRLLARGHDAKSAAGALQVSVNSINERLRDARRKLGTTSSREAARILSESEGEGSQETWNKKMGLDSGSFDVADETYPAKGRVKQHVLLGFLGFGIMLVITLLATLLADPAERQEGTSAPSWSASTNTAPSANRQTPGVLRPTYLVTVDGTLVGHPVESSQMRILASSMASLSSAGAYDVHFSATPDLENTGKVLISVNVVIPGTGATSRYSRTLSVAEGQAANFELEAIGDTPSPGSLAITANAVEPQG